GRDDDLCGDRGGQGREPQDGEGDQHPIRHCGIVDRAGATGTTGPRYNRYDRRQEPSGAGQPHSSGATGTTGPGYNRYDRRQEPSVAGQPHSSGTTGTTGAVPVNETLRPCGPGRPARSPPSQGFSPGDPANRSWPAP